MEDIVEDIVEEFVEEVTEEIIVEDPNAIRKVFIEVEAETNRVLGWASSDFGDCYEIEVEGENPFLSNYGRYFYIDGELMEDKDFLLNEAKKLKDRELNQACQDTILAGFTHTIGGIEYWFSYDKEAQQNFTDAQTVLSEDLMDEIVWTVKQDGEYLRIPINKAVMNELKIVILMHKTNNIGKYRDELMPLVESALSIEEVNLISWKQEVSSLLEEKDLSPKLSEPLTVESLVM